MTQHFRLLISRPVHLQEDASLTRSNAYLLQLFSRAKMQVLLNVQQRKFPKDLFKVRMYVLKHADL